MGLRAFDKKLDLFLHFPTHKRGNILDLVFTNRPENVLNVESLGNLSTSDHSILSVEIVFNSKFNSSNEFIEDWKNGDLDGLKQYLERVNWRRDLHTLDTNDGWKFFKDKLSSGIDYFIPKTRRRKPNNHQWMTKTVKRLVRLKQRQYNLYQQDRSIANYDQFKKTEKLCKRAVRSSKRKFEQSIANNGNKRPFNSYIKSKTSSRVNIGPLKVNGDLITDNSEMATALNTAFSSVFTAEDSTNIPNCPDPPVGFAIYGTYFDTETVKKKILKLKYSNSSGPDKISSRFLIDHVDSLSLPLSLIFTKSMQSGVVPQDWRDANVTPIFKKGSSQH